MLLVIFLAFVVHACTCTSDIRESLGTCDVKTGGVANGVTDAPAVVAVAGGVLKTKEPRRGAYDVGEK